MIDDVTFCRPVRGLAQPLQSFCPFFVVTFALFECTYIDLSPLKNTGPSESCRRSQLLHVKELELFFRLVLSKCIVLPYTA